MHESIFPFLRTFSAESPLLWALLVMAVIAVAALFLYGFWELVLRGLGLAFSGGHSSSNRGSGDSGADDGSRTPGSPGH